MPIWTEPRPTPNVPTLHGMLRGEYAQSLTREEITSRDDSWRVTVVIDDPRSDWYGGVFSTGGGYSMRWFVGNRAGAVEMRVAWDCLAEATITSVRHVITYYVFAEADKAGRLRPYWQMPSDPGGKSNA
uniref:hypothetical protein n=1 Tax=Pseudonocardia sp. CA-138482 TaxID=3240023 RepID=UPI003F494E46